MLSETVIQRIISLVGGKHVLRAPEDRWCYAYDATELSAWPELVVFPGSAGEIAQIVRWANEFGFAVVPRGAGTGRTGGAVPVAGGVVLVLTRMNRILEINPQDLVAVVEPGVITGRLKKAVEAYGLWYPPDPSSADFCTIGGNVAECAGGAMAVQYGVTRDYVLGLEVVLPTGEIIEVGSRTMKGVVGYDLTRLFLGSEGTLGVITRIILRLVPQPACRRTLAAGFLSLEAATDAVGRILSSGLTPTAVEFMDQATLGCLKDMLPLAVPPEVAAVLLLAVDGHEQDVAVRAWRMAAICRELGAVLVFEAQDEAAEQLWQARKAISPAMARLRPHKVAEDVAVPLSAIPALVEGVQEISRRLEMPIICFGHAGDGNIHVNVLYDKKVERERRAVPQAVAEIFTLTRRLRGTLSGEHGVGLTKAPYLKLELSEAAIALQKRLKAAFDPRQIMNPGKIFP